MLVRVDLYLSQILFELNKKESLEFIKEINLHNLSDDFTIKAMKILLDSLLVDMTREEIRKKLGL